MKLARVVVNDLQMAYAAEGEGRSLVFLHGNPTSSHLWRNVIPHVSGRGRCIAPDLVGMGASDKLAESGADSYSFVEHRSYLDSLLEQLDVGEGVVLILHDWGSALGFDWAFRHRERVAGIVFMEALVGPLSWDDWPESGRSIFKAMRGDAGEEIVLDKNVFVERILPASVLAGLSEADMDIYRAPYLRPGESRRPTLSWPRQLPFDGEPADVHAIVGAYSEWLASAPVPKLYIDAVPGFLGPWNRRVVADWPSVSSVTVPGSHFLQEDSPDEIGEAIARWLDRL